MSQDVSTATSDLSASLDLIHQTLKGTAARIESHVALMSDKKDVTIADIAVAMFAFKMAYEEMDKTLKLVYHSYQRLQRGVLPERMAEDNMDMLRVPSIARSFSRQTKMSATAVDKDLLFKWLRDQGQGDLIQETVNASTLTAFCRNLILEQGIDPPEEAVRVNTYSDIGITKYTPKPGAGK